MAVFLHSHFNIDGLAVVPTSSGKDNDHLTLSESDTTVGSVIDTQILQGAKKLLSIYLDKIKKEVPGYEFKVLSSCDSLVRNAVSDYVFGLRKVPVKLSNQECLDVVLDDCSKEFSRLEMLGIYMFAKKLSSLERNYLYVRLMNTRSVPPAIKDYANHYAFTLTKLLEINEKALRKVLKTEKELEQKNIVAILISTKTGQVVGYAAKSIFDPNDHAEMLLLRSQDIRLQDGKDHMLICSLQPCRMCFGTTSFRRIKYCYYLKADANEHAIFSCDTNVPLVTFGGLIELENTRELDSNDYELLKSFTEYVDQHHIDMKVSSVEGVETNEALSETISTFMTFAAVAKKGLP